jgi:hypothetical protein
MSDIRVGEAYLFMGNFFGFSSWARVLELNFLDFTHNDGIHGAITLQKNGIVLFNLIVRS